jgi:hypothetical protein
MVMCSVIEPSWPSSTERLASPVVRGADTQLKLAGKPRDQRVLAGCVREHGFRNAQAIVRQAHQDTLQAFAALVFDRAGKNARRRHLWLRQRSAEGPNTPRESEVMT